MRLLTLDDDRDIPISRMDLTPQDFTYIHNGAADWLSLTVEGRKKVLSFIVESYRALIPVPHEVVSQPKPNVVPFKAPKP